MSLFKGIAGAAVALAVTAGAAQALPTYTTGSIAVFGFTSTTSNVTTTTSFTMNPASVSVGSPTGSFMSVSLPATIAVNPVLDFLNPSTLSFSNGGLGSFSALNATLLATTSIGTFKSATWGVDGTFTLGSDWSNSGNTLTANETYSLTQTGNGTVAVSISGTFQSPDSVPEPATLGLLGAGLAGIGAFGMRRKKQAK